MNNWHNMYLSVDSFTYAEAFNLMCVNGDSIVAYQAVIDPQNGEAFIQKVYGSCASKNLVTKLNTIHAGDRVIFDMIESRSPDGTIHKQPSVMYMLVD